MIYFLFAIGKCNQQKDDVVDITQQIQTTFAEAAITINIDQFEVSVLPNFYEWDTHCMLEFTALPVAGDQQ